MNGISLHFLDQWFLESSEFVPGDPLEVVLFSGGYVLVVMAVFSLLAGALRRWLPEFVGYAWSETSLLPPMRDWFKQGFGLRLAQIARQFVLK